MKLIKFLKVFVIAFAICLIASPKVIDAQTSTLTLDTTKITNSYGVKLENTSGGGTHVAYIQNQDWVLYGNTNFNGNYVKAEITVATPNAGGIIELRLGNKNGTVIGSCTVSRTGSWQNFKTVSTSIKGVSGIQNLCLVFKGENGYLYNVKSVKLIPSTTSSKPTTPPTPVSSNTFYVSPNGNDSNNGTSINTPWKTLAKAGSSTAIKPGSTINIMGGTYRESLNIVRSGRDGAYITYQAYQGQTPILENAQVNIQSKGQSISYIRVKGLTIRGSNNGVLVQGPNVSHIEILGNKISKTTTSGIAAWGNVYSNDTVPGGPKYVARGITNLLVKGNTIYNVCTKGFNECISIANGIEEFEVSYNNVSDIKTPNGKELINTKVGTRNGSINNNTVTNGVRCGIHLDGGNWQANRTGYVENIKVFNNTVLNCDKEGIFISVEGSDGKYGGIVKNIQVYNNIVANNGRNGILVYDFPNIISNFEDIRITNNTIVNNGNSTNYVGHGITVTNVNVPGTIFKNISVTNNITYLNGNGKVSEIQVNSNCILRNNHGSTAKGYSINPQFVNMSQNNYHLKSTSPCISAGIKNSDTPTTDFDGKVRTAPVSQGAFEY